MRPSFIGQPSLAQLASQMCTASQFVEDDYLHQVELIKQTPLLHRKQWEYVYVLRVLEACGMLSTGRRGLGFGVGSEPLAAVLAAKGLRVTATDSPAFVANSGGEGYPGGMATFYGGICPEDTYRAQVEFRAADMRAIPGALRGFDFVWCCSGMESLGSIDAGLDFVEQSAQCLAPGGVGIYTTQFNVNSDADTIERDELSVFRRPDLVALQGRLMTKGIEMLPLNFFTGDMPQDSEVDTPPYGSSVHLKLLIEGFTVTSFGFAVRKV